MNKNVIYGLIDPNTKELRYVGYSCDIKKRYSAHHLPSQLKSKTLKNNWIKSLKSKGQKAELMILEEYSTPEELPQAEIEMIEYYRFIGCNLTNHTDGGENPPSAKGIKRSPEFCEKSRQNRLGNKYNLGHKHTEESKKKMSDATKGNKRCLGLQHSEESKKKMSDSTKGHSVSEETRKKISDKIKEFWRIKKSSTQ